MRWQFFVFKVMFSLVNLALSKIRITKRLRAIPHRLPVFASLKIMANGASRLNAALGEYRESSNGIKVSLWKR